MSVFRQKMSNLSKKLSKFLNFCFSKVSFFVQKLKIKEISPKLSENESLALKMSNLSSFWSKNCWTIAKIFQKSALKMSVFRLKNWKWNIKGISQKSSKKWIFGSEKCWFFVKNLQFFKMWVWKLFQNRPKFLNFSKFCLKNVIFSSWKLKIENWGKKITNFSLWKMWIFRQKIADFSKKMLHFAQKIANFAGKRVKVVPKFVKSVRKKKSRFLL